MSVTHPTPPPPPDPSSMSTEDILDEIFSSPITNIRVLPDVCRGWQIANPIGTLVLSIAVGACASPKATILTGTYPTPINLLLALMGKSAAGKGLAMKLFRTHVPKPPAVIVPTTQPPGVPQVGGRKPQTVNGIPQQAPSQFVPGAAQINTTVPGEHIHFETPASGEAAVTMFYELVPDPSTGKDVWVRHSDPVWSDWPEIDTYVAKAGIAGSSLESNVRQGWSGQRLGDNSISRRKSNLPQTVDPDSYRWIQTIGGQYKKSGGLVGRDAAAGGTTQRAIFAEIEIDRSDFADTEAGREQQRIDARRRALAALGIPAPTSDDDLLAMNAPLIPIHGPGDREISMSRKVRRAFADMRDTEVDEVRQHRHINVLRIASIHAGWRHAQFGGSNRIEMSDWRFALLVMELSDRCYRKALRIVEGVEAEEDVHKGTRMARTQLRVDAEKSRKRHIRMMTAVERVRRYVGRNPASTRKSAMQNGLNRLTREVSISGKELIDTAVDMGCLITGPDGRLYAADNAGNAVTVPTELEPFGLAEQAAKEYRDD